MARRLPKTKWFVADLVMEIKVEGDARNVVHINTVLVRARSLEHAYQRSLKLGTSQAGKPDLNPVGRKVSTRFVGLGFLGDVSGPLEHGVELVYAEHVGVRRAKLARMVRTKKDLLMPPEKRKQQNTPDYANGKIARDYENYLKSFT